jgi:DNA/RNA-binding domain of Phe-tRNA-synthetase-like protein
MERELELRDGWVEPGLAEEFPQLGLVYAAVEARPGRSPSELKRRVRALADRYTTGKVVHLRQDPIPWAYRVFSRQVGLDPDSDRTPVEAIAHDRLSHGTLRSTNLLDDALALAIADTGVPVFAVDGDRVTGDLGLRLTSDAEWLAGRPLPPHRIVVADAGRPLAVVLGEVAEDAGVTAETERMLLCALSVEGVPRLSVEEALWLVAEVLLYT